MSEEPTHEHAVKVIPWYRHSIVVFVSGSIVIALLLVTISMALYASSGAAQLDLSRPGYKSVQSKVDQSSGRFESFSSDGQVNKKVVEEFETMYKKQTKSVDSANTLSSSALDDQALGIDAPGADE
jgi:hypothetical protein